MSGIPRLDQVELKDLAHRVYRGVVYLVPVDDPGVQFAFPVVLMADLSEEQINETGAVWEENGKRVPGVGINGRPVFLSCHLLHRDDLVELHRLIQAMEFAALGVS